MPQNTNQLVYLSLGSNLGDRLQNLAAAEEQLPPGVQVENRSKVYETEPWGYIDQPRFLNQVLSAHTSLSPLDLLDYLKGIEVSLGREPGFRYGPRSIDIDILVYGDQVIDLEKLKIPHQRLPERAFVLVPLAEIAPDLVLPGSGTSIKDLLLAIDASGVTSYQE